AFAQTGPAALSGSAVDSIGRILPGLTIVISNLQSKEKRETRSDSAGRFEFVGLPAGEYLIEAQMPGLVAEDKLTLGGGEHVRRDRRAAARVTPGDYQRQHLGQGSATAAASPDAVRTAGAPAPPRPPPRQSVSQPDVDPCSQSPVGGCIRPPTKVRHVKPRYPQHR